jgi:isopentenyl phosphate kinase
MKPLYILKLGGSVVTHKDKAGASVRKKLLIKVARSIKKAQKKKNFNLILIHGAGAGGHQLAKKYSLKDGAGKIKKRWYGSLVSRVANQELNNAIVKIFVSEGLRTVSVHTASAIVQMNKKIHKFNIDLVAEALYQNCTPVLYGEMVFDRKLGMTICSGDSIAPYLADKFKAKKVLFASDVEGIFDKDPHLNKGAKLIEKIKMGEINKKARLSHSHNIDVTGGFMGKIEKISQIKLNSLESVEIFDGFKTENYLNILLGKKFRHTSIYK